MRSPDLRTPSVQKLLERYAGAARQYRVAACLKDMSAADEQAAMVEAVYQELRARGKISQNALLPFLDHDDPAIRRWAGAHALEFAPGLGKPVLKKLAKGAGTLSLDAQNALRKWREDKSAGHDVF